MTPQPLPIRDIHLPEPAGWWPPASGWWTLLGIAVLLALLLGWIWRRRTRKRIKKLALGELAALRSDPLLSEAEKVRQLSVLLRRAALSVYPRAEIAGLSGAAWLDFLDRGLAGKRFSEGPGNLLADAPYRPRPAAELQPLFELCEAWIRRLPEARR